MIDFELQAGMVEIIFRLIPGDTRHQKAQGYFSCDLVSSAFCDITSQEFEAVSKPNLEGYELLFENLPLTTLLC